MMTRVIALSMMMIMVAVIACAVHMHCLVYNNASNWYEKTSRTKKPSYKKAFQPEKVFLTKGFSYKTSCSK